MTTNKSKNIFYQILILIIIGEIFFTPVAICDHLQKFAHKSEKQTSTEHLSCCCRDNESQCPADSENNDSQSESKCRCAYSNTPSMLTNFDLTHFTAKNPYFLPEFQVIDLQSYRNIFRPPKN